MDSSGHAAVTLKMANGELIACVFKHALQPCPLTHASLCAWRILRDTGTTILFVRSSHAYRHGKSSKDFLQIVLWKIVHRSYKSLCLHQCSGVKLGHRAGPRRGPTGSGTWPAKDLNIWWGHTDLPYLSMKLTHIAFQTKFVGTFQKSREFLLLVFLN